MYNLKNKVQLIGRLGNDPEMKTLPTGVSLTKMRIATSDTYKDAKGEKQTDTQWHNVTIWGKPADIVNRYLSKGSQVMVEGRINYQEYTDKEGQKRFFTEIIASDVVFLDKKAVA